MGNTPKHSLLMPMTASVQANTTAFNWEAWSKLPRIEREAELREALKRNTPDNDEDGFKDCGFDVDFTEFVDSKIDVGSTKSGTEDRTFELIHHALDDGHDAEPGSEAVGLTEDQMGQRLGCWVEPSEPVDKLDTDAFRTPDGAAIDPLTGSKISMTAAINHNAMDAGHVADDLGTTIGLEPPVIDKMGQSLGWWDVASSDMETLEGNQVDDTFMSLSTSDLPSDQQANAMADLLPFATNPLA